MKWEWIKIDSYTEYKLRKKWSRNQVDFAVPVDHGENERKRKDRQITGSCLRTEKLKNMMVIPIVVRLERPQKIGEETGGIEEQRNTVKIN